MIVVFSYWGFLCDWRGASQLAGLRDWILMMMVMTMMMMTGRVLLGFVSVGGSLRGG